MKNNLKYLLAIAISLVISSMVFYLMRDITAKKQAYVDTIKVFNAFEMKKTLEKKMKQALEQDRFMLDSLKLHLQVIYNDSLIDGNKRFIALRETQNKIDQKAYQASQNEIELTDQYNTQIWKQLNQYLKEFGATKELDFMYGTSGQGNILYATEKYDLTTACIAYINDKYLGVE
jgi:outer membrane protein